jgi:hypothetical protein
VAHSPVVGFDYPVLLRGALVGLIRGLIDRVAEDGFPGDHHFLLTFGTSEPGVEMSARLRQRFPDEITIVLQHQFWNLQADGEGFKVTLRFGGTPEPLTVPWAALRAFADPSSGFGLRLQADVDAHGEPETDEAGDEEADESLGPAAPAAETAVVAAEPADSDTKDVGNVLAFSARKRRDS